ncbi:hypothetical protein BH09PAT3_BH09PAT3_2110 [soil metagenome]
MSDQNHIGLDNPAFSGRLRAHPFAQPAARQPVTTRPSARYYGDVRPVKPKPIVTTKPQPTGQYTPTQPVALIRPEPVHQPPVIVKTPDVQQAVQQDSAEIPQHPTPKARRQFRYSKMQMAMTAMAGLVFLVGLTVSVSTLQTNQSVTSKVQALSEKTEGSAAEGDADTPSEDKPNSKAIASYAVAPTLPRYIKIPKLGVSARIKGLSVTSKGDLQAPNSVHDAGWYTSSARPGDGAGSGAMLVDGHVHGPTIPGIFNKLKTLNTGDTIQIVRGDSKVFTYKVVNTQNYDAEKLDMSMMLGSVQPGKAGLNLITCGGAYNKATGHYEERTVVFAVQV